VIYTEKSLRELMISVADGLGTAVTVADLDRILSSLLTSWLPRFLENGEAWEQAPCAQTVSVEEEAIARELAERIVANCSGIQRSVLRLKLQGASDRDIVQRIGISRPTVAKRRREVTDMLGEYLGDLTEPACALVMERLSALLEEGQV
jgi:DNA-binding NarL/FixJ family response regulator